MSGPSPIRRAAGGVAVLGALAVLAAPAAQAAEVIVPLTYSCAFPTGTSEVAVEISATLPDSAPAGTPVTVEGFGAAVSVPSTVYGGLTLLGATSIEGTASASATVTDADGGTQTVSSDELTVPSTPLPSSGPLVVEATGEFPPVTVDVPGTATVAATDSFSARLTPRTSSGGTTVLGTFDVPCTLVDGQDATLGVVDVTEAG